MNFKKTASQFLNRYCFLKQLAQKTDPAIDPSLNKNTLSKTESQPMQTPASQQGPQAADCHEPSKNLPYLSLDDLAKIRTLTFKKSAGEITLQAADTYSPQFK